MCIPNISATVNLSLFFVSGTLTFHKSLVLPLDPGWLSHWAGEPLPRTLAKLKAKRKQNQKSESFKQLQQKIYTNKTHYFGKCESFILLGCNCR